VNVNVEPEAWSWTKLENLKKTMKFSECENEAWEFEEEEDEVQWASIWRTNSLGLLSMFLRIWRTNADLGFRVNDLEDSIENEYEINREWKWNRMSEIEAEGNEWRKEWYWEEGNEWRKEWYDKLIINKLKLNKKCKSLLLVTDMAVRR
jgi:hypothetical protein